MLNFKNVMCEIHFVTEKWLGRGVLHPIFPQMSFTTPQIQLVLYHFYGTFAY